jgi:hypothetical protein
MLYELLSAAVKRRRLTVAVAIGALLFWQQKDVMQSILMDGSAISPINAPGPPFNVDLPSQASDI